MCFRETNPFFKKDILLGKRDGIVRDKPNDALKLRSFNLLGGFVGFLKLQDSTLIMQLLRDNLTLWTSDGEGVEG